MAFKESSTGLSVDVESVSGCDSLDSIGLVTFLGVVNRSQEEHLIPLKGELIHGVHHVHVEKHEIEGGSLLSSRSEVLTRVINLLHGDLKSFLSNLGFLGLLLGSVKGVDEVNIFQERSLLVLEGGKNFIFELLEQGSGVSNLLHILVLSLLNLRSFLLHDNTKALFFKSGLSDTEVHNSGASNNNCVEHRVGHSGGDVQLELGVPVKLKISNHNLSLLTDGDVILGDDVVKSGVKGLLNIF
jgi:hypothetical protein